MKSKKCSQCGLVNFADAFACKRCGSQFQSYARDANQNYAYDSAAAARTGSFNYSNTYQTLSFPSSYQNQAETSADEGASVRKMVFGALWAIGGSVATVLSYSSASGGGKYFIFWGAILFGVIDFLVGLNAYVTGKD
jgi:hypothetical protein